MAKVMITDHSFPSTDPEKEILGKAGIDLELVVPNCKTDTDVIEKCTDADALLVQWAPITRRVFERLPRMRCVVRYGVGVNNVDLVAAKELGVTVANVPDFCIDEVSDHAIAMVISLCRRIPQDHHGIVNGGWGVTAFLPIHACSNSTFGVIGFGNLVLSCIID